MVRPLLLAAACLIASQTFSSALAQQPSAAPVAASTRCGGLFCDLYYAGKPAPAPGQPEAPDPTHLPCHDFLCSAFGGRSPEPAAPAAEPVAAPAPEPVKAVKRKHKVVARKTAETGAAK